MIKAMTAREYTQDYHNKKEQEKKSSARTYADRYISPKIHTASCSGKSEVIYGAGDADKTYLREYLESLGYEVNFDGRNLIVRW